MAVLRGSEMRRTAWIAIATAAALVPAVAVAMPNAFWIFGIDMPGRHRPWSFSDARVRRDIKQMLADTDVTLSSPTTETAQTEAPALPIG